MTDTDDRDRLERRVLVFAPTGEDAPLACAMLGDVGIDCEPCKDLDELLREIHVGVGAILLAEEAVTAASFNSLVAELGAQRPWSDVAVILLTYTGADSPVVRTMVETLGNVTLLERPVRVAALVSAVRSALRARKRQYEIRAHLFERERAAEALKQADRRKDEFVAVLAHELRNPLAPIRNSLHILRLQSENDPATRRVREMMERQVNHMVRLVDDLLEVSRISSGKIELRKERVELTTIVDNAVETSQPLIDAFRHRLTIELPYEPIVIEGDPVRLAQVIGNLLNNAAKYSDESGQIWLKAERRGPMACVSVRDNGAGIAPEVLPHVFNLFMQGDRSPSRSPSGLGIGLTLVKTLVEMHGGTVEALSDGLGHGSEFVICLPIVESGTPAAHAEPADDTGQPLRRRRVLVVDDNRDAADSLGLLLQLLGADVRIAYDGPTALREAATYHPSAVLLDIGMNEMDGYEVARRLREDPDLREVTLVALTGWGQYEDRTRSRLAGFDHHLIKPADVAALEELLLSLDAGAAR
ncbi:MAG: hybrid sensor histidine kinase/response regulator [Candidatus Binatia bacterium]